MERKRYAVMGGIAISGLAVGMGALATRPATVVHLPALAQTPRVTAGVPLVAAQSAQLGLDQSGQRHIDALIGIDPSTLTNTVGVDTVLGSGLNQQLLVQDPPGDIMISLDGIQLNVSDVTRTAVDLAGGVVAGSLNLTNDALPIAGGAVAGTLNVTNWAAGNTLPIAGGVAAGTLNLGADAVHFAGPVAGGTVSVATHAAGSAVGIAAPIVTSVPPIAGGVVAGTVNVVKTVDPITVGVGSNAASISTTVDAFSPGTTSANVAAAGASVSAAVPGPLH